MIKRRRTPGTLFVKPAQAESRPPARPFSLAGFILSTVRGLCTVLGGIILFFLIVGGIASMDRQEREAPLPDQIILTMNLKNGLEEQAVDGNLLLAGIEGLSFKRLSVREMVDVLDVAAGDPRVKALAVSIESGDFGIAHVQELRAAIKRFRAAGKMAYAFSPSYAEAGIGMGAYYLASAFDQIWMQPVGSVALPGYDAQMPFILNALKKVGITPQFFQRKEYKTVMENVSRDSMSPENREMTTSLLRDILSVTVADIAADRHLKESEVYARVDQGVFTDREALEKKLIDRLDYADVLFGEIEKNQGGSGAGAVLIGRYRDLMKPRKVKVENLPQVGFVHATGTISSGDGGGMGQEAAVAGKISSAIMKGVADPNIKVILLRIDSPGGSPTASETIRRAVQYSVMRNKPVIVSMGGMAGSGGYWIATHATRIFALPSTLTGSIGVASGKMEISGLMEKAGVNWEGVRIGKNSSLWSFTDPFSESGKERMNALVDSIYDSFTARVAEGRKLTPEQVEKIARGRVWTGRQARDLGLVDELGGLDTALDYAAKQAGAADRHHITVIDLPHPGTPLDRLLEILNIEVAMNRMAGVVFGIAGKEINRVRMPGAQVYNPLLEQIH